jgi:hypothetical protein
MFTEIQEVHIAKLLFILLKLKLELSKLRVTLLTGSYGFLASCRSIVSYIVIIPPLSLIASLIS